VSRGIKSSWYRLFFSFITFFFRRTRFTPHSFNEKIKYKAVFDRREILTVFADKIAVRDYVSRTVGDKYLPQCYLTTHQPSDIDWNLIPSEFVMKANHCSGGVVIVWTGADECNFLPINRKDIYWARYLIKPDNLDKSDLVNLAKSWLDKNYSYSFLSRRVPEWAYLNIDPQILFEELLIEGGDSLARDYKFHMFNGRCEMINVIERNKFGFDSKKKNYSSVFDSRWKKMSVSLNGNFSPSILPERPSNLEEMLRVASELAQGIDYIRVDLYNQDGRIVFGELTSYPQSGRNTYHLEHDPHRERLNSKDYDHFLGSKLILDKYE